MFHNLFARITACAALSIGAVMLLGCSSSDRQSSPTADRSEMPAAVQSALPSDQSNTPSAPVAETAPPSDQPSASGMKMFIDPATGLPRDPTDAERAAMARQEKNLEASEKAPSREVKLRKRGTAIMIEGNETPLQGCVSADGSVVVDHNCEQAPAQPNQDPKGGKP